ncbi:hypothetical protein [Streptomyces olivoreticuli]|uniref:hypothetical protein n=1 Tax=Streptomyces olivoreticuli TaxID=68246 RepID=UPI0013C315F7|nr:hypothetical protein [Streptomyces olivoreticuli]
MAGKDARMDDCLSYASYARRQRMKNSPTLGLQVPLADASRPYTETDWEVPDEVTEVIRKVEGEGWKLVEIGDFSPFGVFVGFRPAKR